MSMPVDVMFKMLSWALSGDTGASSKSMLSAAIRPMKGGSVPLDPSDFGRCYRLLEAVPELRGYFPQMVENCPRLAPYLNEWDELARLYELGQASGTGRAPELYARLKELSDVSMTAAGYVKTPFGWVGSNAEE